MSSHQRVIQHILLETIVIMLWNIPWILHMFLSLERENFIHVSSNVIRICSGRIKFFNYLWRLLLAKNCSLIYKLVFHLFYFVDCDVYPQEVNICFHITFNHPRSDCVLLTEPSFKFYVCSWMRISHSLSLQMCKSYFL